VSLSISQPTQFHNNYRSTQRFDQCHETAFTTGLPLFCLWHHRGNMLKSARENAKSMVGHIGFSIRCCSAAL
jgi:hypothetical protein